MRKVLSLALLLSASAAHASWVTIDPDNYAAGVPITSDAVRIANVDETVELPVYKSTVPIADQPDPSNSVFSADPNGIPTLFTAAHSSSGDSMRFGLLFEFNTAVDLVMFDGINVQSHLWPVGIDCWAYTDTGVRISCGGQSTYAAPYGEVTTGTLTFDTAITRLYLGGIDQSGLLYFDNLRFNVPEPSTYALYASGLLLIGMLRRKRSS